MYCTEAGVTSCSVSGLTPVRERELSYHTTLERPYFKTGIDLSGPRCTATTLLFGSHNHI